MRQMPRLPATIAWLGRSLSMPAHQIHVELDDVGLELGQEIESGVARTEIVDGGLEAIAL